MLFFCFTTNYYIVKIGECIRFSSLTISFIVRWKPGTSLVTPNGRQVNSKSWPFALNALYFLSDCLSRLKKGKVFRDNNLTIFSLAKFSEAQESIKAFKVYLQLLTKVAKWKSPTGTVLVSIEIQAEWIRGIWSGNAPAYYSDGKLRQVPVKLTVYGKV